MFHRLPRIAIVAALACSIGLHWGFLQSVAWVGMVVNYSRDGGIGQALVKTFDGKHPCPLCKVIKNARAEEKQQEQKQQVKPSSKMELGLVWQSAVFFFSSDRERISSPETDASSRSYEPPKPRPRTA
jgi:hypothetical protein